MNTDISITKDTTIAELFDAHPKAEQTLLRILPAFAHLENPTIRDTIIRVTTLEKAAATAHVAVEDLLQQLRSTLGLPDTPAVRNQPAMPGHCGCFDEECQPTHAHDTTPKAPPAWADNTHPSTSIDADAILAKGHSPLEPVTTAARQLAQGEVLRVLVGFRPTPMIQTLEKQGYETCCRATPENRFELLITPAR